MSTTSEISSSWAIEQIDPTAPNLDNADDFPDYRQIYEKDVLLQSGTYTALVYEHQVDPRVFYSLVFDDTFVAVMAEPDILTDDWFATLDFISVYM